MLAGGKPFSALSLLTGWSFRILWKHVVSSLIIFAVCAASAVFSNGSTFKTGLPVLPGLNLKPFVTGLVLVGEVWRGVEPYS
jgi:hypothetical protein